MKKALFSALCVLVGTCSLGAPKADAMSLDDAKAEICTAAHEYRQYGATFSQSQYEVKAYANYLAVETGNPSNRYAIAEAGTDCLWNY